MSNPYHEYKRNTIAVPVQAETAHGQEPESFEQWNAKQHGDPEEIGFLQALRIAYCAGQDSVANATPPAAQPADEPVACGYDETTGNCTKNPCCYDRPQEFVCSTGLCHYKAQRQWTDIDIDRLSVLAGFDPAHKVELGLVRSVVRTVLRGKTSV